MYINLSFKMDLLNLNDDCLIHILEELDLKDQTSAARACTRFQALLSEIWQRKHSVLDYCVPEMLDERGFTVLLDSICSTVRTIYLYIHRKQNKWDIIKLYSYPNIKCLIIPFGSGLSNEDILKMTEIFPNLRSFTANDTTLSWEHIKKWQYLEDLSFDGHCVLDCIDTGKMLEKAPLKSIGLCRSDFCKSKRCISALALKKFCNLEKISLCSAQLYLLSDFSLFSNLKVLHLRDFDFDVESGDLITQLMKNIAEHRQADSVELWTSHCSELSDLLEETFRNRKKLLPNIHKIVFRGGRVWKEEHISRWLNFSQIEFISVENCDFNISNFTLNVMNIVKSRTTPLHFNFYKNHGPRRRNFVNFMCDKVEIGFNVQGESPLLKVTQEDLHSSSLEGTKFYFKNQGT